MYVSAILIAILLAGGYALYAWLRQYRRANEHVQVRQEQRRTLTPDREKNIQPIELTTRRRPAELPVDPLASLSLPSPGHPSPPGQGLPSQAHPSQAHHSSQGLPSQALPGPSLAAPRPIEAYREPTGSVSRAVREHAPTMPEVGHSAPPARRVRRRDPTMQISAAELAEITLDDDGTTLADAVKGPREARRRVSLTSEVDLSVEIAVPVVAVEDEEGSGPYEPISVHAAGATHVGKKRKHNEDAIAMLEEHSVYVLADGMGGYAAGEVASQMCVESILRAYRTGDFGGEPIPGLPRRGDELVRAIQTSNSEILHESRTNEERAGMGTTVVAARFVPARQRVYIGHVGDSRLYRLRKDELAQLTTDHTLGAQGVTGPAAQKLSRAIGVFDEIEVDLNIDVPEIGDVYLICSDGLFKMLHELRIVEVLSEQRDPQKAADALVDEANARGGKDNISVIVLRIGPAAGSRRLN